MSSTPQSQPPPASANTPPSPDAGDGGAAGDDALSPLEQQVLDEYARLLGNFNALNQLLADLSDNPSADILDALRGLERKTSLVFTLLKASVYSIVLQQQIGEDGGASLGGSVGTVGG